MRELRFRAWVFYGEKLKKPHYSRDYESLDRFFEDHDENDIDQCIEQYTGLKDKNGKEIYEGDILKFEDSIFEVGWFSKGARFGFCPIKNCNIGMGFSLNRTEVIGNIHENAELLKKEK